MKETDGNSYRSVGHVALRKKHRDILGKILVLEASDWEQPSGFCFLHVIEIKHFTFFFFLNK